MRSATVPRSLPRPGDAIRRLVAGAGSRRPRLSPRLRRRALVAIVLAALLGAIYMLWLRDSSLVRVERVSVSGLSGSDAPAERARLVAAAKRMTTLHVDEGALIRALGPTAAVDAVHATAGFPHALRIEVVETQPVAILFDGAHRLAVGPGGRVLVHVRPLAGSAPQIDVGQLPSGNHLPRGRAFRLVAAAAAAPPDLRRRVERLRELPGKGLVAYLRRGPQVLLGDASELHAKWVAAAAVLADGSSRGASYVDVRIPDRPVAGGLPIAPPTPDSQTTAPAGPTTGAASGAPPGSSATAPATGAGTAGAPAGQAGTGPGTATGGPTGGQPSTTP